MKEGKFYYYQKTGLNQGNFGSIDLESLSEDELDKRINGLNKRRLTTSSSKMNSELAWLFKESKNYSEQKMRKEMATFRNQLKPIIYPCGYAVNVEAPMDFIDSEGNNFGVSE